MVDDIERINRRIWELLEDLQTLPETFFRNLMERGGFGGGKAGIDPYRVLGLDREASDEEVKKRYRQRLRQFHPDTAGPGMEFHLQLVMMAYELIKRERGWQ